MLAWLVERLAACQTVSGTVIATSDHPGDDAIEAFAGQHGLLCFRGPLTDVAGRLLAAAQARGAEAFVRISGDSPLIDPTLVDRAVGLFATSDCDLASNVVRRTFPKGQSVEVVRTAALARAITQFDDPADREHVTPWFYRNADKHRIVGFESGRDAGAVDLSVDTASARTRIEALIAGMSRPLAAYGWSELIDLLTRIEAEAAA